MATLNAEHINPFLMAAKKVLQDMCFVDVAIQKPILKEAKFDHDYWVIIIGVTGEMRGQVLIGMTEETACAIASKMCMMEVKTIDDFAAIVFSSNGVGIDITPPTLSHGEVSFTNNFAKTLCVPMAFADGSGSIDLFLALRQED